MLRTYTRLKSPHLLTFFLFFVLTIFAKTGTAQETTDTALVYIVKYSTPAEYKPFPITGRIIGTKLESIKQAEVINACTGEITKADDNGIFHFRAAKGDTLAFTGGRYSPTVVGVKSQKEKLNIILIKRKTGSLPPGYTNSEYEKAKKEDDQLYKILDKDAKEEGKWNY